MSDNIEVVCGVREILGRCGTLSKNIRIPFVSSDDFTIFVKWFVSPSAISLKYAEGRIQELLLN